MRSLISLLVLPALLGCEAGEPTGVDPMGGPPPAGEVPNVIPATAPFTVARFAGIQGYIEGSSGLNASERIVIRTQHEWAELWDRMLNAHSPKPPIPFVDFSQHMLLVAAMGGKPTGGYAIRIESVSRQNAVITAHVRLTSPGNSCFTTQAFTEPADIVRIARSELPVVFHDEQIVHEC